MKEQILGIGTLAAAIRHHIKELPAHFLWCAWDTPIGPGGEPNSRWVLDQLEPHLNVPGPLLVVINSQLPVGTCGRLELEFPGHRFVAYPENVRAAHAVEDFGSQPRIVLGSRNTQNAHEVRKVLEPFTRQFIITDPETAEMVKHGLNGFLAVSVTYAHELAAIAKNHGANPDELALALLSDPRIGAKAYLKPGGDMGAHLEREVHNLVALGGGKIIEAVAESIPKPASCQ